MVGRGVNPAPVSRRHGRRAGDARFPPVVTGDRTNSDRDSSIFLLEGAKRLRNVC